MKKYVTGFIVGAILFVPISVVARSVYDYDGLPTANDIYQFNCGGNAPTGYRCNHAAVFDDQDNKCYVTYDPEGRQSAISCIKAGR